MKLPFQNTLKEIPSEMDAGQLRQLEMLLDPTIEAMPLIQAMERLVEDMEENKSPLVLWQLASAISSGGALFAIRRRYLSRELYEPWAEVAERVVRAAQAEAERLGVLWTVSLDTLALAREWDGRESDPRVIPDLDERMANIREWVREQKSSPLLGELLKFRAPTIRESVAQEARPEVLSSALVKSLSNDIGCAEILWQRMEGAENEEQAREEMMFNAFRNWQTALARNLSGEEKGSVFDAGRGERNFLQKRMGEISSPALRAEVLKSLEKEKVGLISEGVRLLLLSPDITEKELEQLSAVKPFGETAPALLHPNATAELRKRILGGENWGESRARILEIGMTLLSHPEFQRSAEMIEMVAPVLIDYSEDEAFRVLEHPHSTLEMLRLTTERYKSSGLLSRLLLHPRFGRDPQAREICLKSRAREVHLAALRYAPAEEFADLLAKVGPKADPEALTKALEEAEIPVGLNISPEVLAPLLSSEHAPLRLVTIRRLGAGRAAPEPTGRVR